MKQPRAKTRNLRESCVLEAMAIIGETGIEELSLREVARRLGVSHQAPYKHFPSRDHLLAEIVSRAFAAFAQHLDARRRSQNPHEDLAAMGRAYLDYAREHPLHYRLMFGTPLPDPHQHPEMMRSAQHAFSLLRDCLTQMLPDAGDASAKNAVELDALFVWSTMHGLATILQTSAIQTLALPSAVLAATTSHTLQRIGIALSTEGDLTLTKERAL
jgi:AcrR family transcriptional regulator